MTLHGNVFTDRYLFDSGEISENHSTSDTCNIIGKIVSIFNRIIQKLCITILCTSTSSETEKVNNINIT